MKINTIFLSALLLAAAAAYAQGQKRASKSNHSDMKNKKVLFVVTSTDQIKTTGAKTGLWIEEFATPYYLLTEKGIAVTIASPNGGRAPIDPKSTLPEYSTTAVKRFFNDTAGQEQLEHTRRLSDINPADYDAVFYPGGHGPMWDLPNNAASINIIETYYNQGKPVALVCHAPAALQNVKDKTGVPLIKGKKVAGFTNSEENAGKSVDATPFLLEDMLKEKGADYVKGNDWQPFAVADGLLITGQNPASAELVAQKIIEALSSSK